LLIFTIINAAEAQSLRERLQAFKERREAKIAVTDRYQISGPIFAYAHVQDLRLTPLIYPGPGAGIYWSSFTTRPDWTITSELFLQYNHLSGPLTLQTPFRNPHGKFENIYYRNLRNDAWGAGGGVAFEYQSFSYSKLENDAYAADALASLLASASYTRGFRLLQRDAWLRGTLTLPLFSYINRVPEFNIGGMEHIFGGPETLKRVVLKAELIKLMKHSEENRVSISYELDFYHLKSETDALPVRVLNQRLRLGFWLKRM
jgi:hypothetical protein